MSLAQAESHATEVVYDLTERCSRCARAASSARAAWERIRTAASASRCCRTTSPRARSGAWTSRAGRSRTSSTSRVTCSRRAGWWRGSSTTGRRTGSSSAGDAYSGALGGPLADLAGLVGEVLTVERVPISHQVVDGVGTLDVGDFAHCEMEPFRGADGTITALRDSIFSTVPGSPAYPAKAKLSGSACRSTGSSGRKGRTPSRRTTG